MIKKQNNMVKLNFAHLCEYAFLSVNNTPAIIGIFSKVFANSVPATRNNTSIVVNFRVEDKVVHRIKITVVSPLGKDITKPIEREVGPAQGDDQNLGYIANIGGLTFNEKGEYKINIFVDDNLLTIIPFIFSVAKG